MYRSVLLICLLFATVASHARDYKYLVFKGGGIRGIAYTGALKELERRHITDGIEKAAGTSVGAITAALFSVGYSADEMRDIMYALNIKAFNDGKASVIGGQKRMRKRFGWYRGERLEQWIGRAIRERTGTDTLTFRQLHALAIKDKRFKDLYVTATNLTKQSLEIFSWESYPDMPVKTAVRASVSIPLYFSAVFLDPTGKSVKRPKAGINYNVFVDGGLLANYPIGIFNTNHENAGEGINEHTLGLKLDRPEQIAWYGDNPGLAPYDIHSFSAYISALYNITIEQLNKNVPYEQERKNTIYISTSNLNPRVRHITTVQKRLLFDNGANAAKKFFNEKDR